MVDKLNAADLQEGHRGCATAPRWSSTWTRSCSTTSSAWGRGDQIPADAVVVSGEALVNESLLTGESDPIKKQPGSELMSGSFIDSGLLRARVIHVAPTTT